MRILCVGDGFGKGHVWPMWPQLLLEILEGAVVDNLCEVGAGNEFISTCLIDALDKNEYDIVLVQWAMSKRLDIINNRQNNISNHILEDETYKTKYSNVRANGRSWWLSSGSKIKYTQEYHEKYISAEQHKLRSINYIKLIQSYLEQKQIPNYLFFSSDELDFLDLPESNTLDRSLWCSISMQDYSESRFATYKTNEVQPHPVVHLNYIKDILLPKLKITVRETKFKELLQEIEKKYASAVID